MKERIIKVYEFKELSKKAKENAIKECYDINIKYDDCLQYEVEDFKEHLKEKGFPNATLYYDLSCCQGSGACFESDIDLDIIFKTLKDKKYNILKKFVDEQFVELIPRILKNSYANHYCHYKTRYIDIEDNLYIIDYNLENLNADFPFSRL